MKRKPADTKRRSTFAVLFYLNRGKSKKNGLCPLMGRITIDTGMAVFSAHTDVNPALWDAKQGRATGKGRQSIEVNHIIDRYTRKINACYDEILDDQGYVTAELVKNALNGIGRTVTGLLKLFEEHNREFELCVGHNRTKGTYDHYLLTYKHLSAFVSRKYGSDDMPLKRLDLPFIEDFDFYLRFDRRMGGSTISNHLINLKKIVRRAVGQGTLKRDPFFTFAPRQPEKKCRHLGAEEIRALMQTIMPGKELCHTRDMFVFSCMTGLAYADLCKLSGCHLREGEDGSLWISINRRKTGTESSIRLLDIPRRIIEKYRPERRSGKLFNMKTPGTICAHLGKIGKLCGIGHITFHMARHNFATHVTLAEGVPIETISRMMGHGSIRTTQIYAKITNRKVDEDMKRLSGQITGRYNVFEDRAMPVEIDFKGHYRRKRRQMNK
jgi:integrase